MNKSNEVLLYSSLIKRHSLDVYKSFKSLNLISVNKNVIWVRDYFPIYDKYRGCYYSYLSLYGGKYYVNVEGAKFLDVVFEGGNCSFDSDILVLTDKIYSINRSKSINEINYILSSSFDRRVIVIDKESFDSLGHTDGIVRFVGDKKVILNDYLNFDDLYSRFQDKLINIFQKLGYEVYLIPNISLIGELEMDDIIFKSLYPYSDSKNFAFGYYINFAFTDNLVLVPSFVKEYDIQVYELMKSVFPERDIKFIYSSHLSMEGGVLNCVTANINIKDLDKFSIKMNYGKNFK